MAKKRKTLATVEKELAKARSVGRNASNRLKAYKEGMSEGIKLAKEAKN